MKNLFRKITAFLPKLKYNALMGILFAVLVVLPDYLYMAFLPNITYLTDAVFFCRFPVCVFMRFAVCFLYLCN